MPTTRNQAYRVLLNGKEIDRVYRQDNATVDEVRDGLVNHDGYDSRIIVIRDTVQR